MTMAYINIGSNQGDRKAHIDRAVAISVAPTILKVNHGATIPPPLI